MLLRVDSASEQARLRRSWTGLGPMPAPPHRDAPSSRASDSSTLRVCFRKVRFSSDQPIDGFLRRFRRYDYLDIAVEQMK